LPLHLLKISIADPTRLANFRRTPGVCTNKIETQRSKGCKGKLSFLASNLE
jgi:hypothetical protein